MATTRDEGRAVSQSDSDFQLYTLVNGVTSTCDVMDSLDDITSLGAPLEFG